MIQNLNLCCHELHNVHNNTVTTLMSTLVFLQEHFIRDRLGLLGLLDLKDQQVIKRCLTEVIFMLFVLVYDISLYRVISIINI